MTMKFILLTLLGHCLAVPALGQLVTGFTLVDAAADTALGPIADGGTIDLSLFSAQLSMTLDVSGSTPIGSVVFTVDGGNTQTENLAPYALGGNIGSDYNPVPALALIGNHEIIATCYSGGSGSGSVLETASIAIQTIQGNNGGPTPVPVSQPTLSPVAPPTLPPFVTDVPAYPSSVQGTVSGEQRKWHKITIGFQGPQTSENANPNPFTYYRLDVTFRHDASGAQFVVPGYFAADGNAANTKATAGNVWLVHFAADRTGSWTWTASFKEGNNVAQNCGGSSAGFFDGISGSLDIGSTNKTGRDHRGKGRLQYVGKHHLQFAETGEYFLKAGADAPENFLAYDGFDNTPNNGGRRKSWSPHAGDYNAGDPTWAAGTGFEIIGAINYLSERGANAFSFLPMNIGGDDKNVFPYISDNVGGDRQRIDVSKTAQWEVLFEHADHIGMYLHFKTQETENDQLLDGGNLGNERKLYYRELIARFSHHLALHWNLGEENTNSIAQLESFANFFKELDPYDHPIVVHTFPGQKETVYGPLVGFSNLDGASLQSSPSNVFSDTLEWRDRSAVGGHSWVVACDEQGNAQTGVVPDSVDPNHDVIRENVLWGNIMAGGAGVEYYFGYGYPNSDLTCQDFRSRANMWDQSRYALEFFNLNAIPFWNMATGSCVSTGWCLAESSGDHLVVYLKDGGSANINLPGPGGDTWTVKWYDPRNGGTLQNGSVTTLGSSSSPQALGNAPNNGTKDWVILLRRSSTPTTPLPTLNPVTPEPTPAPVVKPTTSKPTSAPIEPSTPQPTHQPVSGGMEECESDCDLDSDCASQLLCADAHKPELKAAGYDVRKAYCGPSGDTLEVCYDPTKL